MDEDMMKKLILTIIWPMLEYETMVWFLHKKETIMKSEGTLKSTRKMVTCLRSDIQRKFERLGLISLEERWEKRKWEPDWFTVWWKISKDGQQWFPYLESWRNNRSWKETKEDKVLEGHQEIQHSI